MSFIKSCARDDNSDMCWLLDVLKSKKRPSNEKIHPFPFSTQGIRTPLINSLGKYWTDFKAQFPYSKSRTFINSYYHLRPITPDYKAVD